MRQGYHRINPKSGKKDAKPIVAITRGGPVYFDSESEVISEFGIANYAQLYRMIDGGTTWAGDGYTTFDFADERALS